MLFFFTESIASEVLDIIAVAGVLKGSGLRNLPILYIFDETLLAMILAVYAVLVNRIERTRLFNLMEATFGTLVLFLWMAARFDASPLLVGVGTYAVKSLAISILEENFWQFVDDIYDVREAKRLTPIITTAGVVGGIVGAAGIGIVSGTIIKDLNTFRLIAPALMFSGIFFMMMVKRAAVAEGRLEPDGVVDSQEAKPKKKKKKKPNPTFREGIGFVRSSPLFTAIFFTFVVAGVVAPLGDFVFQGTADLFAQDEAAYARFLAFYKTSLTIVIFFAQLFISGRLMKRLGLSNSQIFTPINNIFKFALMIPFITLSTAIYAQGSKKLLEKILQKPAQRILFGFAPKRQKNTVRVFIKQVKGYAAIATLLALFVMLQLMPAGFEDPETPGLRKLVIRGVCALLILLNVIWLYYAYRLKKVFAESLVQILQSEEVDFDALERQGFRGLIDQKTVTFLLKNLEAGSDKRAIFITDILGEVGDSRLLRPIADLMPQKSPEVRRALVRLAGRVGGDEARPFLLNALKSRDPGVREQALKSIGENGYTDIHDAVRPLVDDEIDAVQVAAAAIMLHSSDVRLKKEGTGVLDAMLRSDEGRQRANGLYLLGQMGVRRNLRAVVPFLSDTDPDVRLEALRSIGELADRDEEEPIDAVMPMLEDPHVAVRAEAALLLGRLHADRAAPRLVATLSQRGFAVRKAAVTALAGMTRGGREALAAAVTDPNVDLSTKELILRELRHTGEASRVRERLIPRLDAPAGDRLPPDRRPPGPPGRIGYRPAARTGPPPQDGDRRQRRDSKPDPLDHDHPGRSRPLQTHPQRPPGGRQGDAGQHARAPGVHE